MKDIATMEILDLIYAGITLIAVAVIGSLWPLANRYIRTVEQKAVSSSLRRDLVNYVLAARQLYTTHTDQINYILEMVAKRYPDMDIEYVRAQIEAVFAWIENNMDLQVYIGKSEGDE
jgi:hypothetical protein